MKEQFNKLKIMRYFIVLGFLILIFLLFLNFILKKINEDKIINRTINLNVQSNGEVLVEDIIDVQLTKNTFLTQYFRNIDEEKFSDIKVSYYNYIEKKWFPMKENTDSSIRYKYGNFYNLRRFEDTLKIYWYTGVEGKKVRQQYKVEYLDKGSVTKYLDVAEYYNNFIGNNFYLPIKNSNISISFPNKVDAFNSEVIVKGTSNFKTYFEDDKIKIEIKDITENNSIETRILFPKNYVKDLEQTEIYEEDSILMRKINTQNSKKTVINSYNKIRIYNILITILVIYLIILLFLEIARGDKIKKYFPTGFIRKWDSYTDLPQTKLDIAAANLIYRKKNAKNFLITVLMKLQYKKILEIIDIKDRVDLDNENMSLKYIDEGVIQKSKLVFETAKNKGIYVDITEIAKIITIIEKTIRKENARKLKVRLKDVNQIKFKFNLDKIDENNIDDDELMVIEYIKEIYKFTEINDNKFIVRIAKLINKNNFNLPISIFLEARDNFFEENEIRKMPIYIEQYQLIYIMLEKLDRFEERYNDLLEKKKIELNEKKIYSLEKEKAAIEILNYPLKKLVILIALVCFSLLTIFGTINFYELEYLKVGIVIFVFSFLIILINMVHYLKLRPYLTNEGKNIREEYRGLYKSLNNTTFIREHGEDSLVIWGEYLVLATYFGITKKVIETLQKINPDVETIEGYKKIKTIFVNIIYFLDVIKIINLSYRRNVLKIKAKALSRITVLNLRNVWDKIKTKIKNIRFRNK